MNNLGSKVDRTTGSKSVIWFSFEVTQMLQLLSSLEGKRKAEVVVDGLRLLKWALLEKANGRTIGSFDSQGEDRTTLDILYGDRTARMFKAKQEEETDLVLGTQ